MDLLGLTHTISAVATLATGLAIVALPKGTARHRRLGRTYVVSMVLLNGTALAIYDLYDSFGPFHITAVVSLATVCAGFLPVFLRRPRKTWLDLHSLFMAWSIVGLLAAAAAEFVTRFPWIDFGMAAALPSAVITAVGAWVIHTRVSRRGWRRATPPAE